MKKPSCPLGDLCPQHFHDVGQRLGPLIGSRADGDGAGLGFLLADDEFVGDFGDAGGSHLGLNAFGAGVDFGAEAGFGQFGDYFLGVVVEFLADGQNIACTGASQRGKSPPKCSMRTPMKRSMLPKGARWIITGRWALLSVPV